MNNEQLAREIHKAVENANYESTPQEITVNIRKDTKKIPLPPTIMVFQAAAYLCSTILNASTNRILMYFFSKSGYENYIGIDVKTLMEELTLSKPTVVKGLKDLEKNHILVKYKNVNDSRRHDYFINPITAWRGNSFTRNEAIKKIKSGDSPNQLDLFNIPNEKKSALKPNSDF